MCQQKYPQKSIRTIHLQIYLSEKLLIKPFVK